MGSGERLNRSHVDRPAACILVSHCGRRGGTRRGLVTVQSESDSASRSTHSLISFLLTSPRKTVPSSSVSLFVRESRPPIHARVAAARIPAVQPSESRVNVTVLTDRARPRVAGTQLHSAREAVHLQSVGVFHILLIGIPVRHG